MIIKNIKVLIEVLFLAIVFFSGISQNNPYIEDNIPVEIVRRSSSDSIFQSVNINVNYKYGADSLHRYLQKQLCNKGIIECGYVNIRGFIVLRFDDKDLEKVFIIIPNNTPEIDTRIGMIIGSSIAYLKNDWIFPEYCDENKYNSAVSIIEIY